MPILKNKHLLWTATLASLGCLPMILGVYLGERRRSAEISELNKALETATSDVLALQKKLEDHQKAEAAEQARLSGEIKKLKDFQVVESDKQSKFREYIEQKLKESLNSTNRSQTSLNTLVEKLVQIANELSELKRGPWGSELKSLGEKLDTLGGKLDTLGGKLNELTRPKAPVVPALEPNSR